MRPPSPSPATPRFSSWAAPWCSPRSAPTPAASCWPSPTGCCAATTSLPAPSLPPSTSWSSGTVVVDDTKPTGEGKLRPVSSIARENDDHGSHPGQPTGGIWRRRPVVPGALRCPAGARLPVLSGGDKSRDGVGPAHRTRARELACALVRDRLHPGLHAAGSSSRRARKRPGRVSAGAGAHRRAPAHPLRRRAHRAGAGRLALLGPPRHREARAVGLVAFGACWHGFRGQLVGVYHPDPGRTPGADGGQISGGGARGARHACPFARGRGGFPFWWPSCGFLPATPA